MLIMTVSVETGIDPKFNVRLESIKKKSLEINRYVYPSNSTCTAYTMACL